MEKNINEYFDKSDLKQVKDLLKSLDLKVEAEKDEPEVSHQAFYNTFSRPDKEEKSPEEKQKLLKRELCDLIQKDKNVTIFWDVNTDSVMIQILVDGQNWSSPPVSNVEELLTNELNNTLHFPNKNEGGYSTGSGKLYLNTAKQLVLDYATEEEYSVKEQLEDTDLWAKSDLPEYIITNRFFENNLSCAAQFDGMRRGFNAEISIVEGVTQRDFYFVPALEISEEGEKEFTKLLLEKVDKMALERHQYDFSKIKYQPNFSLNGQISAEKVAVLNLEVDYMIFEKQMGEVALFDFLTSTEI
ncbi:MAG: hypothetical protein ACPG19_02825 [Saprospiraceae bacterium]